MYKKSLFFLKFICMQILLIGIGGFLGAVSRFFVQKMLSNLTSTFPIGILTVNVLGSFLLGVILYGISFDRHLTIDIRDLFAIGFMGSFTTMSAFSHDTLLLFEQGHITFTIFNVILNVVLCLLGVYLGKQVGVAISR